MVAVQNLAGLTFFNDWDSIFVSACNKHDTCYVTTDSSFSSCNEPFRQDMLTICSQESTAAMKNGTLFNTSECWDITTEYYVVVRTLGASRFEGEQKYAACINWAYAVISSWCDD
tara:strand:+ start:236 stop:580 length:345 start_codon:yes stop_codon:yes gene_type:complete